MCHLLFLLWRGRTELFAPLLPVTPCCPNAAHLAMPGLWHAHLPTAWNFLQSIHHPPCLFHQVCVMNSFVNPSRLPSFSDILRDSVTYVTFSSLGHFPYRQMSRAIGLPLQASAPSGCFLSGEAPAGAGTFHQAYSGWHFGADGGA